MKRIPESKVARWPQSITKLALIYACCFVLAAMISFSVCYAYFSSKIEATGNITVGKLEIQYVDGDSNTLSTLQTTITRDGSTILDENEEEDLIIPADYTIIPGDIINIKGNIKNTGSIDAFVVIQAEFMLMSVDGTTVAKTFDSKFYDLSGNLITYDTTNKIYTTPATVLSVDEAQDLTSASLSYTVSTGLTSEYSGRTFKLRLTTHAIQSEKLEKDEKYGFPTDESADDYETLTNQAFAVQATNMLLNRTPHLVTDAKIYGNSVQKVGNGKNLFSMYDFVEYQNNLADDESNSISTKSEIVSFDGKTCLYAQAINLYDSTTKTFYYWEFNGAPSTQYTISFKGYITQLVPENAQSTKNSGFRFFYSDGQASSAYLENMIGWQETTFTTTSGKTIIGIGLVYNYSYMTYYTDIQLEQGTTATEYVPYAGKNLFNLNGTIRPNSTATISVSGNTIKSTVDAAGTHRYEAIQIDNLEVGQTYTLSATWTCSGQNNGQILFAYMGSTTKVIEHYLGTSGSSVTCTITEKPAETDKLYLLFYANFTGTCNVGDYITYSNIQVEYGTVATAYEPYVGSPSTKAPVEIESVGEKTKNLCSPLVKGISLNFTTGAESTNSNYATTDYIAVDFNNNANYYLSGLVNGLHSCVFAYNSNKEFLGRTSGGARSSLSLNSETFTSGTAQGEGNIAYLRISQYYVSGTSTNVIDDVSTAQIQLEVGTSATEYEPYGYKVPVKVSGKNLFNINDVYKTTANYTIKNNEISVLSKNQTSYEQVVYNKIPIGELVDYYLSFNSTVIGNGVSRISVYCYNKDNTLVGDKTFYSSGTGQTVAGTAYVEIRVYANLGSVIPEGEGCVYSNIQLEKGSIKSKYEPYIGNKTYTIYLDEPLRKVGDVADYIEIKDGVAKVVRNVYEYIVTGDETYTLCDTNAIRTQYGIIPNIKTYSSQISVFLGYICSHNIFKQGSFDYLTTYSASNPTTLEFRKIVENWGLAEYTVDAWVAFVKEELEKGTPITIQYILATPTEETILLDDMFTLAGDAIYEFNTEIAPSDYYFS